MAVATAAVYQALAASVGATLVTPPQTAVEVEMDIDRMDGPFLRDILRRTPRPRAEDLVQQANDELDALVMARAANGIEQQGFNEEAAHAAAEVQSDWQRHREAILGAMPAVMRPPDPPQRTVRIARTPTGEIAGIHAGQIFIDEAIDTPDNGLMDMATRNRAAIQAHADIRARTDEEFFDAIRATPTQAARFAQEYEAQWDPAPAGIVHTGIEPIYDNTYRSRVFDFSSLGSAVETEEKKYDGRIIKFRSQFLEDYFTKEDSHAGYAQSVMEDIFSPLISKIVARKYPIISCSREKFLRTFGIKSNILEIFDEIREEIASANTLRYHTQDFIRQNTVLFGGKLVDLLDSKDSGENDFDLWLTNYDPDELQDGYCMPDTFKRESQNHRFSEYSYKEHKIQIMDTLNTSGVVSYDVPIEDVLRTFDFRHCAIAVDHEKFYWIKGAIFDIRNKNMVINKFIPSKTIGMRMAKYASRGFKIALPDIMLASIMQLSSVSTGTNPFEEQLFTERNYDATTLHELTTRLYEGV